MIKKLQKKFIRISMAAVTAVMLLLCVAVNAANYISVRNEQNRMLNMIYNNQGKIPEIPHPQKPNDRQDGFFTPETPFSTRYFVLLYDDGGTLTKADLTHIAAVAEDDTAHYLSIAVGHGEGNGATAGYRYSVHRVGDDRWMAIFLDCHQELRSVASTAMLSLIAAAVCVVLVYIIIRLSSRRAIAPMVRATEKQKQFITDASHELKTPITVIATCLSVLEMDVGKQKWIDKANYQIEKLKNLVNSLVTLAKLDEDKPRLHFARFSVSDALTETADSFYDYAASRGLTLNARIEPDTEYTGDEYAVRQLVSVLLDNAVKYALPDSEITLTMTREKKDVIIQCRNACEPLPPDQLARLFDRFYHADEARNVKDGGFGIGLSIARSIAEAHNGFIRAASDDGHSVTFTAVLRETRDKGDTLK